MISCPCIKYNNLKKMKEDDVKGHMYFNRINISYEKWIWHGDHAREIFPNKRVRK